MVALVSAVIMASGIYFGLQKDRSRPPVPPYPGASPLHHTNAASEPLTLEQMATRPKTVSPSYRANSAPKASTQPDTAMSEQDRANLRDQLKYSTTVELVCSTGTDELGYVYVENEVRSYISRQLRSLGDVEIVEKDGEWLIEVLILPNTNKAGVLMGFFLSVVISKPFPLRGYRSLFDEKAYKILEETATGLVWNSAHRAHGGAPDDLQAMSRSLVANFDTMQLQPDRDEHQKLIEQALTNDSGFVPLEER